MNRAQIEARIAELKVENEKAPGGAGTNARAELIRELEAQLPCSAESCDLKPCPFCGVSAHLEADKRMVVCDNKDCYVATTLKPSTAEAIEAWNRRTFTDAQASKEQITAQVLLAMSDKVGSDTYGVSHALKINKGRAEKAAESILSLLASQPSPAATVETEVRGQAHRDAISPSGGKMFNAHPSSSAATGDVDLLDEMKHGHVDPIADRHYAWAVAEIERLRREPTRPKSFTVLVSAERLTQQIVADPDLECEAGPDLSRVQPQSSGMRQAEDCLKDWLRYAEENLSEFDVEDGDCCEEKLCPKCENSGCIQYKIRETRIALTSLAVTRPQSRTGKICSYHDGCPPDGPVCHLCAHLQPTEGK